MSTNDLNWIVNYIWGIADDVLRDLYVRGKYRDVILEDRADLALLDELDWAAIDARDWRDCKEGKQAEFLVEQSFPWELVSRIGVSSRQIYGQVRAALEEAHRQPHLAIRPEWYY